MKVPKGNMKPLLKVLFGVALAVVLFYGSIFCWAALTDAKHRRTAREVIDPQAAAYLAEQYPGNDFEVGNTYHVFTDNCFRVNVRSRSSRDTHFYLIYPDKNPELCEDQYDRLVLSGYNTRARLEEEYRALVLEALPEEYWITCGLRVRDMGNGLPVLDESALILDADYDLSELGAAYGTIDLTVTVSAEDFTTEYAESILKEVDSRLTACGAYYSDLKLQLRIDSPLDYLYIPDLTPEQIRSENLHALLEQLGSK